MELQSNLNYENCQPKLETKDTPESHSLLVHLPGYSEDDIGAQFEYDYRRVRVFGGRTLGDSRSIRFNIVYAVPWNCDMNKLKGMFQGEIYRIIMPKVTILREVQDENSPGSSSHEKGQMGTCEEPKSITESQIKTNNDEVLTTSNSDFVPQKGEEGISQDDKNQREERFESSEKKRVDGKETKEESENASTSGKPPQKGKGEDVMDETSFITKNGKLGNLGSPKRRGIKEVAASASQAVTSLVKEFNENDNKHVLLCTSATVLMLALGVYASYKLRSLART